MASVRISKNTVVSLDVTLADIWGNTIEVSDEPLQYLHGGYGNIFPAAEAALEGKGARDRVEVRLEPEDAFGDYDENPVILFRAGELPHPFADM